MKFWILTIALCAALIFVFGVLFTYEMQELEREAVFAALTH